jgi:hypothetical protein
MAVMDDLDAIAQRYRTFAALEARGSSPSYVAWSRAVAGDRELLARLATLPARKQQPNLVFAALRWHGEEPGDGGSLRHGLLDAWGEVSQTIMGRATQTNEPARCAVLLPLLHRIGGLIALIELGAAAGLCLIPDRYSYAYSDGTAVHPPSGPSDVTIRCRVAAGSLPRDLAAPQIIWRAGVDLNPLDPADPDTAAWLTAEDRTAAAAAITGSGARWISFEGRDVVTLAGDLPGPVTLDTAFVAALDRVPFALASGHADTMTVLGS